MLDKRLFSLAPGIGRLVAAKALCLWVSLLAEAAFVLALVRVLMSVLTSFGVTASTWNPLSLPTGARGYGVIAAIFAGAAIVKFAAAQAAAYFGTEASERVKLSLRERLYRKMLRLGQSYSQHVRTSDVVQFAGEGIEQIQSFFELFLPQLFFAILAPITLFVILLPVNLPAAVVLLVCAPLIVLVVALTAATAARVFMKYWGKYTDMGAVFLDDLQGLETLKTFDADARAAKDMDENAEQFRVMTMRVLQVQLRSLAAMDLVAYGGAAAGIGVAFWQFAIGNIGLPEALVVVLLSASFFLPLRQLGSYFHVAMNGMTSTRRVFGLIDTPEPGHGSARLPANVRSVSVAFHRLGFEFERERTETTAAKRQGRRSRKQPDVTAAIATALERVPALRDITFTARPGAITAIVGVSGSGKSTAAALLAGTISGYSGSLTLSYPMQQGRAQQSVELSALSAESQAGAVTLVSAQSHLFQGTLKDNLLMADPQADDDALWAALQRARIDDFVRAQPEGLGLPIEQNAANLSGGQRQRFAIARALLRATPVYVFDEATSSVDVESGELIHAAIHELAEHATVLMITHRLAEAADAGRIMVFDHGKVAETGTHEALLASGGEYAKLFHAQESVERIAAGGAAVVQPGTVASAESKTNMRGVDDAAQTFDVRSKPRESAPVIGRLLAEASPLTRFMILACVFGTIGHLAAAFLPVFAVFALFARLGSPIWGMSVGLSLTAMAVCAMLRGVTRYTEQYMNHNLAFRLLAMFRSKAFAALRRLAPAKLAGKGSGDLISLITTDVELLEIFFAHTISPVVIAVVTTVVYAVALCALSPWFVAPLIVAHLIVGVAVPKLFSTSVRGLGRRIRKVASALDDRMLDDMRGLDEIIRFNQGESRLGSIISRTRQLWSERSRLSRRNGSFSGLSGVLVMLVAIAAAMLAVPLGGSVPALIPADIAAVVLISSSFGPTSALSALPASLTQTFAAARRLFALFDEAPAVDEAGTEKPAFTGMALDHVTFAYPRQDSAAGGEGGRSEASAASTEPVLADFSLTVPSSGILGIQGPSGQGKSTMLKLLMRYWDPQQGSVVFSGASLPRVSAVYRRGVQTMMGQETYLFDGTIRKNLLIANAQASDGQLREALRKASLLGLVDSLPEGLDTQVGELGGRLSEGERQRIGLTRMFLRKARLVLFDEPTSRLDALNEAVILISVNDLAKEDGVAVVLVSHRASALGIAGNVVRL